MDIPDNASFSCMHAPRYLTLCAVFEFVFWYFHLFAFLRSSSSDNTVYRARNSCNAILAWIGFLCILPGYD